MAEEAEIMIANSSIYKLTFEDFRLDFELDIFRSVRITDEISDSSGIYPFAVVDVRFSKGDATGTLSSAENPENFLEDLRRISAQIEQIPEGANMAENIACGEWCAWMKGYWDRIEGDCVLSDDETVYDELIKCSVFESREAHLAAYLYSGRAVVEFATRGAERIANVRGWSQFDPAECIQSLRVIACQMRKEIFDNLQLYARGSDR
ncbi:hypothetical protein H5407_04675 [Mitsuaria sp. WAJ17]|uniref:hypothetical protein n=1 Tax=Mitsuaria sp. WAJ17 TaxID=2761452 RepID=UPI0016037E8E|nr:hypothetical protein [Mitsuaria sp. WAJ17]MBB2484517.1 hypothetical protein [Mitsuaria sp. WAJ17]